MNIFLRIFLIIFLFLLIYSIYRSEIYWQGKLRNNYLFNYFILITLIIIFITVQFINKIKVYFIIIFISFFFSLYLFELFLHYKYTHKELDLLFNAKKKYQIYSDFKKKNDLISTVIPPMIDINTKQSLLPLSGISNIKTIHCTESDYTSIYLSDRYGFNNPDEEWNNFEVEYLLIGDSFAHGACVNRPNDIASVIRSLSKKNVLNLGYSGIGPLMQYAILREYFPSVSKNIIWLYFEGNDMEDLKNELSSKLLNNYLNDKNFSQNLKFKQNLIDKFLLNVFENEIKKIQEIIIHENFVVRFIKLSKVRILLKSLFYKERQISQNFDDLKKILDLVKNFASEKNAKLYFVYLPEINRYNQKNHIYDASRKVPIKKIVDELNITLIDIDEEIFMKEINPLNLFPSMKYFHYNIEGYNKIAIKIYEKTNSH